MRSSLSPSTLSIESRVYALYERGIRKLKQSKKEKRACAREKDAQIYLKSDKTGTSPLAALTPHSHTLSPLHSILIIGICSHVRRLASTFPSGAAARDAPYTGLTPWECPGPLLCAHASYGRLARGARGPRYLLRACRYMHSRASGTYGIFLIDADW